MLLKSKIECCLKTLQTHLHAIFKHDIDVDMNSIELDFSHILTFQLKSSLAAFYFSLYGMLQLRDTIMFFE